MQIFPNYYKKFRCIGGECKHNCCIGWEIDIDEDTLASYKNVGGAFGDRLRASVNESGVPCFILGENERCPFLNRDNLCDIIITLGEENLCTICAEHPRFHNELPDRVESGIGLACEEAARIILSEKEPFSLVGAADTDDEIILLRDKALEAILDRTLPLTERIEKMLSLAGAKIPEKSLSEWAEILLSLERLDPCWTDLLNGLKASGSKDFSTSVKGRENECENLLCYFIYRHMANAPDLCDAAARAAFAFLACRLIFAMAEEKSGLIETSRLFSSEIEYSDENLHLLFDLLRNVE